MLDAFCTAPLWECNQTLINVAQGKQPADIVIRHTTLVNVLTHELLEDADIALSCGRVAYVGFAGNTAQHCIGDQTQVIDAHGTYAAPAFMDAHIHVESAMIPPAEYACAVVPHGTSAILWDPHEAMNVAGIPALKQLIANAHEVPLKCMITPGSCIPAVPGFEDTGSSINADEIRELMALPDVVGLGEMMNDPGILSGDFQTLAKVNETLKSGKTVTGHFTMPDHDQALNAYAAAGISNCHESTRVEDIIAKLRLGMYGFMREGSAWHNLQELSKAITTYRIDPRMICLVSDDMHPEMLVSQGHLDRLLRMAVANGIDPITALQMVTINVAQCFGLDRDMGSLTPGKCADIVLLEDLESFNVVQTFIDGALVAKQGEALFSPPHFTWEDFMLNTMRINMPITKETFAISASESARTTQQATVRVIASESGSTLTAEEIHHLPVHNNHIECDPEHDILKAFVFERHHHTNSYAYGFVRGFGIHGALAQTVAHDAHNLLVVGDNDEDMARAANELIACGGGEIAVCDGEILGKVELPLLGLMSDKNVHEVAKEVAQMEHAWQTMGCSMASPFMTMGLLSLACIPELRLTNKGYVDCINYLFAPLEVPKD